MPSVSVDRGELFRLIGISFSDEEFEDLCFKFGLEVDQVYEENGQTLYKIDVGANRYDLLCVEGIGKALSVFLGNSSSPIFSLQPAHSHPASEIFVKKEKIVSADHSNVLQTSSIRPYIVGAILRNVTLTEVSYRSLIDLQDKLHLTLCRKRSLVSIGTYDLDKLKGPFTYEVLPPEEIKFIPLNQSDCLNGVEIMNCLESHQQLKAYLPLIKNFASYPVLRDSNLEICSLIPIINGEKCKISVDTKNILIDCTGTDLIKTEVALNIMVSMFSGYCSPKYHIEPVTVKYETGHSEKGDQKLTYPDIRGTFSELSVNYVQSLTGISDLNKDYLKKHLLSMMINSEDTIDPDKVLCHIPLFRSDIMHPCDFAEDVAIAYGFNSLPVKEFQCIKTDPLSSLCDQLRSLFSRCGYHESLNWGLLSIREGYEVLCRKWRESNSRAYNHFEYDYSGLPVRLENPKTKDFEIVRPSLIPGLFKTLSANKSRELPIKLFEVGDVCFIDDSAETGARNLRYCAALFANNYSSGLEEIHGTLDIIMEYLGFLADYLILERETNDLAVDKSKRYYRLVVSDDPAFLKERQVHIRIEPDGVDIGIFGVLSPLVLEKYGITLPVSILEINLEILIGWCSEFDLYEE